MGSATIALGLGLGGGKAATSSGRPGGAVAPPFVNEYSLNFDGSDDVMTIPQGTFDLGTGNWTFSLWFKADSLTTAYETLYLIEGDGRSPSARLGIFVKNSEIVISDWHNTNITYTATISDGTWYHVVGRKEGSGSTDVSLFLNGTEQATGYFPNTTDFGDDQATTKVGFGQPGAGNAFDGKIDEFAFWPSALSDADRTDIYNGGTPASLASYSPVGWWRMGDNNSGTGTTITDQGSGENDGTLTNGPTFSPAVPPGYSNKSVAFDGTDDYMDCGNDSSLAPANITISLWYKQTGTLHDYNYILTKYGPYYGAIHLRFRNTGKFNYFISFTSGTTNKNDNFDTAFTLTDWHHVALTYDGSYIKGYVDGVEDYSAAETQSINYNLEDPPDIGTNLHIGKGQYDYPAEGLIDEVSWFNSALSASDITAIYNSGVPADLTSLSPVGWWRMGDGTEDGSGTTIYDMSSNSNNGTLTNGPTYSSNTP